VLELHIVVYFKCIHTTKSSTHLDRAACAALLFDAKLAILSLSLSLACYSR